MFFLIRSAVIGAIIFGLCIWAFDASVSWTWYAVSVGAVCAFLLIGAAIIAVLKWAVILTFLNDLDRDYRS